MKMLRVSLFFLIFISFAAFAVPAWKIVPEESSLSFTATQNNSPATGQFKSFTGTINGDPADLSASHVEIIVNTGSVSTSYKDLETTLKTPDWFDVSLFPQAVFRSNNFVKTGDKSYQAKGTLTIRDKTLPVTLSFTLVDYSANKAKVTGTTTLKRTAFGIGQGDWSNTSEVKNDVVVNFTLSLIKK